MPRITITAENGNPQNCADALTALFGRQEATAPQTIENGVSLAFGTLSEEVAVEDGMTVAKAFGSASNLGMEAGRALTFQTADGKPVDANQPVKAGESYLAVPNHDPKG